jgi:hypothetical protein
VPSEDEDFDFEDWVDNLHGLLHVIQPLPAEGVKSILNGQIKEIPKGLEISRESEISYDKVPRSEKAEKEDERLRMVETWHSNLEQPEGLSDTEYVAFIRYADRSTLQIDLGKHPRSFALHIRVSHDSTNNFEYVRTNIKQSMIYFERY